MSDSTDNLRKGETADLVRAAQQGGRSAWSAVFQLYEPMLRGHARALIARQRYPFDVEELVQATLQQAWSGIQGFRYHGEGSFRHWLQRLQRNLFLNECKRAAARPEQASESGSIERAIATRSLDDAARRARQLSLDEALGALSDEDREILLMLSEEKLSLARMAEILACSPAQAQKRLSAAQERLRRRLAADGDAP